MPMFVVDAAAREVEERERDARTIFCFNLPIKGTEDDIAEFFEKNAGEVEGWCLSFVFLFCCCVIVVDY